MKKYQTAPAVKIELSKTVTLSLLDETKTSEGELYFSKGKMRLEIQKPEETTIVLGEQFLWVAIPTPKELGGKMQITKIKSKGSSAQSKVPLVALLSTTSAWDAMKIIKETKTKEGHLRFDLVPQKPDIFGEITSVTIEIKKSSKQLMTLVYKDELDNETKYNFRNTNFKAKVAKEMFSYVPPKNAEITEY